MTITLIALLIITGIILILVEIFLIPGISVVAIAGAAFIAFGIFYSFSRLGPEGGWPTVIVSVVLLASTLTLAFRSNTWNRVSLNKTIEGKIDPLKEHPINIGDEGVAVTRLAPMGKVKVNGVVIEAKSNGGFIDPKTPVTVLKVLNTNIIVKSNSELL